MKLIGPIRRVRTLLSGTAALSGTTVLHDQAATPVSRPVELYAVYSQLNRLERQIRIDAQWSSAAGQWAFTNLDPTARYAVIAYDPTGQYDPVIKIGLTASEQS